MADLAPGFEEVPLAEGFEEVPLNSQASQPQEDSDPYQKYMNMIKSGVETTSDLGRGLVQGGSMGFSDEAIAAAKATMDKASGNDQGRDWKDLYRQYQQEEEAKVKATEQRSPIASKVGEIGGALLPAVLTAGATAPESAIELGGAAAKPLIQRLAQKAAVGSLTGAGTGAVYGAGTSEGKLIDANPEEQAKLLSDIKSGAETGAAVGGVLGTAVPLAGAAKEKIGSKLTDYITDSPFMRQMIKSKQLGEQGVDIYKNSAKFGKLGEGGLITKDTEAARDLMDRIYNVDSQLGKTVGKAIDDATDQGVVLDLTEPMMKSVNTFKNMLEKDSTLMANPKAQKLYDKVFQLEDSNLTPKEVQSLRDDVVSFADAVKIQHPDVASLGYSFQNDIGNLLKQDVPGYALAADRFSNFRRLVPETIISGNIPADISNIKLGNMKNDEAKLFSSIRGMLQGSQTPGWGTSKEAETFKNLIEGLHTFETSEAEKVAQGLIKQEDVPKLIDTTDTTQTKGMESLIKDKADQSALLQQAWRVNPQENIQTSLKGAIFGRAGAVNLANKYGLYKNVLTKPIAAPVELTQKMYSASESELRNMAEQMSQIPGLGSVGKTLLNGLDNKDTASVNSAIFSIMQNPQARIFVNGQKTDNEEK